jgi:uncharacterized membrane protein
LSEKNFVPYLLFLAGIIQVVVWFFVLFDVPIARQVVGFAYLTFVPGITLFCSFGERLQNRFTIGETIVLSAGLSFALIILTGLFLSIIPFAAIKPLSTYILLITLSIITSAIWFFAYFKFRKSGVKTFFYKEISLTSIFKKISLTSSLTAIALLVIAAIGIFGTAIASIYQNNLFLMLTIIFDSILVLLVACWRRFSSPKWLFIILLVISVSLISFVNSFTTTSFIVGSDIHSEFYAFRITADSGRWIANYPSNDPIILKAFASLGVTILPASYYNIAGIEATLLFKILYPIIAVFIILGVYQLLRTQIDEKSAFLASFFFIIISVSYGWGPAKQIVAELFYVLLFLILLKKDLPPIYRNLLLIVFGISLVVTHYSLSYIFMFTLFCWWIAQHFFKKGSNKIHLGFVVLFFTLAFSWYLFVSNGVSYNDLLNNFTNIGQNFFTDFFNFSERGDKIVSAVGGSVASSSLHEVGRYFFYLSEFAFVLGFLILLYALVRKKQKLPFSFEFIVLILINILTLGLAVIIPNLAGSFLVERFYQIGLIILSPLYLLGILFIFEKIPLKGFFKKEKLALVYTLFAILILIPNFIFNIGFVYEAAHDESWSMPLSYDRMKVDQWSYIYTYTLTKTEVSGAVWLSSQQKDTNLTIYADYISQRQVLLSYGLIDVNKVIYFQGPLDSVGNNYVYLKHINTVLNTISTGISYTNTSVLSNALNNCDVIYSTGDCVVYKGVQ